METPKAMLAGLPVTSTVPETRTDASPRRSVPAPRPETPPPGMRRSSIAPALQRPAAAEGHVLHQHAAAGDPQRLQRAAWRLVARRAHQLGQQLVERGGAGGGGRRGLGGRPVQAEREGAVLPAHQPQLQPAQLQHAGRELAAQQPGDREGQRGIRHLDPRRPGGIEHPHTGQPHLQRRQPPVLPALPADGGAADLDTAAIRRALIRRLLDGAGEKPSSTGPWVSRQAAVERRRSRTMTAPRQRCAAACAWRAT
jgi:hypothetical protein